MSDEATPFTPYNYAAGDTSPGPRPGLGGWGLPGEDGSRQKNVQLGPVLGYAMEKIVRSFGLLRGMTMEGDELKASLKNLSTAAPGRSARNPNDAKRKKATEALAQAKIDLASGKDPLSVDIIRNEDLLGPLEASERAELVNLVMQTDMTGHPEIQGAVLHILRNAKDKAEFEQLLEGLGGLEKGKEVFVGNNLGAFCAITEFFEVEPWYPPFHHPLFLEDDPFAGAPTGDASDPLDAIREQVNDDVQPVLQDELIQRFIEGDINASDLMGFSREELYMIAQRGYDLLQEGKLTKARSVFEGLVFLDPYDPYFHTVLGSVQQKQESFDSAVQCYSVGIKLQPWNINALANRGEILFNQGRLTDALSDFQKVLYYDPEDSNPSTLRTKALLIAIKESVDAKAQEVSQDS